MSSSNRRARRWAACVAFASACSLGFVTVARAAPTAQEVALAETLFRDAQRAMKAGNYAEACPKFAESQRLDPAVGTLMNLAACHEAAGQLASAWAEFTDAAAWAKREGRADRLKVLEERLKQIEPRLSTATLVVSSAATELSVELDGSVIGRPAWNTPMPINPGRHKLRVSAPGFKDYTTEFEVGREKDAKRVAVPALEPAPAAPASPAASAAAAPSQPSPAKKAGPVSSKPSSSSRTKRVAAYVTAGTGLGLVGVGSFFGVRAVSKMSESDAECPNERCTATGAERSVEANSAANVANVCVGVGLAAIGVGAYLYFTSGSSKNEQAARVLLTPTAGPGAGGLLLRGEL
ncbi:MAG TPA: PEGA domain-containing protein [Polyangiaceae bacterium]|nr:PEGA domain-containing protein [Polyangiaceae bacterium]